MSSILKKALAVCLVLMAFFILTSPVNAEWTLLYNIKAGSGCNASDLDGDWYFSDGYVYGELTVSGSGSNISGSLFDPEDEVTLTVTGGSLSIDADGAVTGTVIVGSGVDAETVTIDNGILDEGKTFILAVLTDSSNDQSSCFFSKGGGSASDLAGTWYIVGGTFNWNGFGTIELDASGNIIDGSITDVDNGSIITIDSGNLAVDVNSALTGSLTDSVPRTGDVVFGFINGGKRLFALIGENERDIVMFVGVKAGGTFSNADLEGTWYSYGGSSEGGLITGLYTLNASGSVTDGTITTEEGAEAITGNFSLDADGVLDGSVAGDGDTSTVSGGKMEQGGAGFFMLLTDQEKVAANVNTSHGGCFISTIHMK